MKAFFLLPLLSLSLMAITPGDLALENLMEGNKRFVSNEPIHPNQDKLRRETVAGKQQPFAVIVCCSDSRVAPEIIFDRGLGDTFAVRVAGNVVDDVGLESVRFAADNLKAPLIMVLGHERCGAVDAVLKGGEDKRDIPLIADKIEPAIVQARKEKKDPLTLAIKLNAQSVCKQLIEDPVLKQFIEKGSLKIVPAYYDFTSGKVYLLD